MSEVIPASDVDVHRATRFYVVSQKKFAVLFLATLGLYTFYWWYKQWKCYMDGSEYESQEYEVWPVARALFPYFFTFALFREVNRFSLVGAAPDRSTDRADAALLLALILVSEIFNRLAYKSIGSPYTDLLSFVILVPLLSSYSKAQAKINISCKDPEGAANCTFTRANYAWIAVGGVFWLLTVAALIFPN